jgi:hypothetical protein
MPSEPPRRASPTLRTAPPADVHGGVQRSGVDFFAFSPPVYRVQEGSIQPARCAVPAPPTSWTRCATVSRLLGLQSALVGKATLCQSSAVLRPLGCQAGPVNPSRTWVVGSTKVNPQQGARRPLRCASRPLEHSTIRQTSPFGEDSLQSAQRTTGASKPVPHGCANADGLLHARRPGRRAPRLSSHRLSPPVGKSVATREVASHEECPEFAQSTTGKRISRGRRTGAGTTEPTSATVGLRRGDRLPADPRATGRRRAAR